MTTKAEWKECAERRLVENLALRTLIEQMNSKINLFYLDRSLNGKSAEALVEELFGLVRTAKEVGKNG